MTTIPAPRPVQYMTSLGLLTRETLEDSLWDWKAHPEIRADYEAGCKLWLIRQWADGYAILGPHPSFADRTYAELVSLSYWVWT